MSIFVAGLDLGQAQDYTALIIVEAHGTIQKIEFNGTHPDLGFEMPMTRPIELPPLKSIDIRHIERFPLGTKYQQIAIEMGKRVKDMPTPKFLAIDQTGVGMGVFEMMRGLNPMGITITGGQQGATMPVPNQFRVPKRDLIAPLQVHLQNGTLKIAKELPFVHLLIHELQNFKFKISTAGHDSYEAWREADHDDLVLAAGIAAWVARVALDFQQSHAMEWLAASQIKPYEISPV